MHALEKEIATHSSILAWRIPGTEEPGGLPSMRLHRVGHDWSDLAAAAAAGQSECRSIFEAGKLGQSCFQTSVTPRKPRLRWCFHPSRPLLPPCGQKAAHSLHGPLNTAELRFFTRCLCSCSVAKSCPTLYDPMDYRAPGFSVHGIS